MDKRIKSFIIFILLFSMNIIYAQYDISKDFGIYLESLTKIPYEGEYSKLVEVDKATENISKTYNDVFLKYITEHKIKDINFMLHYQGGITHHNVLYIGGDKLLYRLEYEHRGIDGKYKLYLKLGAISDVEIKETSKKLIELSKKEKGWMLSGGYTLIGMIKIEESKDYYKFRSIKYEHFDDVFGKLWNLVNNDKKEIP